MITYNDTREDTTKDVPVETGSTYLVDNTPAIITLSSSGIYELVDLTDGFVFQSNNDIEKLISFSKGAYSLISMEFEITPKG